MKKSTALYVCLLFSYALSTEKQKPERAENAQVVVGNLAQMIGQIGNIIENPHDAHNVGNAVSHMIDNIIKITIHAVQNKSINITDAHGIMEQLHTLCKKFNNDLADMITIKKSTLTLA